MLAAIWPLLLASLCGCWKAKSFVEERAARPFEGAHLTIGYSAAIRHPDLLEQLARDWSARSGAGVTLVSQEKTGGPQPDVMVIAPAELSAHAAKGELQEVPSEVRSPSSRYLWSELSAAYADKLLRWGNKVYALPVLGEGQVLVVRSDILADANTMEAFAAQFKRRLTPPETWEEFTELAEFLAKTRGKPSLPPLPERVEEIDRLFYTVAAPYERVVVSEASRAGLGSIKPEDEDAFFSFHYSLKDGKPRIDHPGFVHALSLLERMEKCRPPRPSDDPGAEFLAGNATMMLVDLETLARLQSAASLVRNKFAIAPIPGSRLVFDSDGTKVALRTVNRVPYLGWGGWVGAVSSHCASPLAAWDFLIDLGNPTTTSLEIIGAARWGAGPYRLNHLEARNRSPWYGFALSEEQTDRLVEQLRLGLASAVTNYAVRLRTPDERAHMIALAEEVKKAVASGEMPEKALQRVVERWRDLDKDFPANQRQETYRKSLGL